jgi:Rieske Fe-S protein
MSDCTRRRFLENSARAGVGALVLAQLSACTSGGPVDGTIPATNGQAELTFTQFPNLATVGGGVVVDANGTLLVVIRTGDMTATALSAVCTHSGCTVEYVGGNDPISCPCHGSTFNVAGAVLGGPARRSLKSYTAAVDSSGVTVTLA